MIYSDGSGHTARKGVWSPSQVLRLVLGSFPKNDHARYWLLLAFIVGLGALLRMYGLPNKGLTYDEFQEFYPTRCATIQDYFTLYFMYMPDHPPLFFLFRYGWLGVFGYSVYAARMIGVLSGIFGIILSGALVGRLWGRSVGLWAALLFAFSPCFIMQAQMTRSYPVLMMLYLLSLYAFCRALQEKRKAWWAINVIVNIVIVYTHLFGAFLLLIQGVFLLCLALNKFRLIVLWTMIQVAAILPAILFVMLFSPRDPGDVATNDILHPALLLLVFLGSDLSLFHNWRFFFDFSSGTFLHNVTWAASFISVGTIFLCYIGSLLYFFWRFSRECWWSLCRGPADSIRPYPLGFLFIFTFLPWVLILVLSFAWRNCFAPRFVWPFSSLGLLTMTALAFMGIRSRIVRAVLLVLLVAAFGYQLALYYPESRGDGALGAGRMIKERYTPGDIVFVHHGITEVDQLRFEMNAPSIPVEPVYSTIDMCHQLLEYTMAHKAHGVSKEGAGYLWFVTFPTQADFYKPNFDAFLERYAYDYEYRYIHGDLQCLVYRIRATQLPHGFDEFMAGYFPTSENVTYLLEVVGIQGTSDLQSKQEKQALRRAVGLHWFFMQDTRIVLPLAVGFPLLERGALEIVELLARRLAEKHRDDALPYLLLACARFEQDDSSGGREALSQAMKNSHGFTNRYALLLVPLLEAVHIQKNGDLAEQRLAQLDDDGVIFPHYLRRRTRQLSARSEGKF